MSVGIKIDLTGEKELLRKLHRLPIDVEQKVIKRAIRAANKPVVQAMKARVPVDTGRLRKSIGKKERTYRRSGTFVVIDGPRIKLGKLSGRHGHLVEEGTVERFTKQGVSTGIMPATPFMDPAFRATADKALTIAVDKIRGGVMQGAKRG